MSKLFVGIDVSSKSNVVGMVNIEGEIVSRQKSFPNNLPGSQKLAETIKTCAITHNFSEIIIGMEATSFYDWHLADFLATTEILQRFKVKVYRINAQKLHKFRKSLTQINQTDKTTSCAIAHFLRIGRGLPTAHIPYNPYIPLQRLTRYRMHLVNTIVREVNHLLGYIFLQNSSLVQSKPFKPITSKTSINLITEFTPDEIINTPLEKLVEFLIKNGKNRFKNPQEKAELIKKVTRESFRIRPELAKSVNFIIINIVRNIRALKNSIKEIDKAIQEEIKAFPNTLTTVPGIGHVLSAGIIAEIQDIRRYKSHNQIAKLAGLVWPNFQSGDFQREETRIVKASNTYLRYYLIEAANSVRRNDKIFSKYYRKKYTESRTHKHKRALVLTARKLIRLIFFLLTERKMYVPYEN